MPLAKVLVVVIKRCRMFWNVKNMYFVVTLCLIYSISKFILNWCVRQRWISWLFGTLQGKRPNITEILQCTITTSVGAASQCYWVELMLLKCELMKLKCELLKCELMLINCDLMLLTCELVLLKFDLMLLKCELMLLKSKITQKIP